METWFLFLLKGNIYPCPYPTYEEWKLIKSKNNFNVAISPYPTYEEWKPKAFTKFDAYQLVLILPMRNGNSISPTNSFTSFLCPYPTYEEWKLFSSMTVNINS